MYACVKSIGGIRVKNLLLDCVCKAESLQKGAIRLKEMTKEANCTCKLS